MAEMIRKLSKEDLSNFWEIVVTASGDGHSRNHKESRISWFSTIMDNYEQFGYYGLFRNNELLGGMALIDFKMNLLSSTIVDVGGVGMMNVHLLHKKEKVCREMMKFFLNHYREKGCNIVLLSPFNVEFYKKMGFGYGTKVNLFRIKPSSFPKGSSKKHLSYIDESDKDLLLSCYERVHAKTHGYLDKTWFGLHETFSPRKRIVAFKKDNVMNGYIVFDFASGDLILDEFVFETREALLELCTFLNSQSDQISRVVIHSQYEHLHFLLTDPTDGINSVHLETNTVGIGMMYRVINVRGLFESLDQHNFNDQSCILKITLNDNFFPENNGSTIIQFNNGKAQVTDTKEYEVEVELSVSDFSSLIMGAVNFKALFHLGLAEISELNYLDKVHKVFFTEHKPVCITDF